MNKINKKTRILIGAGSALSIGTIITVLLKKKTKKLSDLEEDDFDFDFDETFKCSLLIWQNLLESAKRL